MKLWQWMQLNHTHSGYMDVAGKEELGGGAGVEEPGVKEQIEEKDAAHTDELEGLSAEELIAKVREERKTSAGLLKESMKRKGNELSLKEKLAKYGDIAPERAIELVQAESAALKAREYGPNCVRHRDDCGGGIHCHLPGSEVSARCGAMIEGLIARFKAFVMTAAAVIAVLFGAYILGGYSARRSIEIRGQREENKRLRTTVEIKNETNDKVRSMGDDAVDSELAANWMRD